ncbi:neurotrimin-like isoform X2 [Anoplophora glabripennis]|uniref:neurotrimin-like isoform X2 n=1 Tax=Anoplophora glabripennis TaxID=217634 RepID=UPI00087543A6|nr:neurotrimin-like isoform X2 [Anoplophora glabripennis]
MLLVVANVPAVLLLGCFASFGHGRHVRNIESNRISVLGGDFNHDPTFPRFAEPIPNVTVTVGRDALLACVVDNLNGFKVAWVRVDTQTILSIHHNVITQNPRISLSYNDHRSWYLHIKNVQEVDRGWYMCQVNTDPMRSRQGYLQVVVPPSIIDRETSSDMVVLESTNVSLTCKATGYPEPYVMWRREDGEDIRYNGENVNVVDGEVLFITKVSRLHMAVYLCIASNGVPPSISKRVQLKVQFPPMLSIPNQLEGAYIGQDVTLECRTEAFPTSINYWTTERGDMIISGDKYEAVSMDNGYKKYMMLKIRRVNKSDFGSYKCVAKNSLGETDGVIKLEEIPAPTTVKPTVHLAVTPALKKGVPGGRDRMEKGGSNDNRVGKGRNIDESKISEYDYDGEYTLPSNGPPPIQEPPGAFSGAPGPASCHRTVTIVAAAALILLASPR